MRFSLKIFLLFLDKGISIPEYILDFSDDKLKEFHRALVDCISYIISFFTYKRTFLTNFYINFAKHIVDYRNLSIVDTSNVTLISINWDTLFDTFYL